MGGLLPSPSPPPGEGSMIRAGRKARRGDMALGKGSMGYERGEGTRKGKNRASIGIMEGLREGEGDKRGEDVLGE